MKKRIVVIRPGRGSYTKDTLGYLKNHSKPPVNLLSNMDQWRSEISEPSITAMDSADKFNVSLHTKGEHASPLIYTCSYADFLSLDKDKYEVVAVCGNSMGWYLTLSFAGALNDKNAFRLVQAMGSMMKSGLIGGQIIYPLVKEDWTPDEDVYHSCLKAIEEVNQSGVGKAYVSIWLGGYLVIGGEDSALKSLQKTLPKNGDYPFQLINHGAFHTPLMDDISKRAFQELGPELFEKPKYPMIDGRGHIWQPYATDLESLRDYTLGHQVYAPYDFTTSVSVALKEFAPDQLVLLGPGNSLGGVLGQIMIQNNWYGIASKADFQARQKEDPLLWSMGLV